jgi:hypothetical protein
MTNKLFSYKINNRHISIDFNMDDILNIANDRIHKDFPNALIKNTDEFIKTVLDRMVNSYKYDECDYDETYRMSDILDTAIFYAILDLYNSDNIVYKDRRLKIGTHLTSSMIYATNEKLYIINNSIVTDIIEDGNPPKIFICENINDKYIFIKCENNEDDSSDIYTVVNMNSIRNTNYKFKWNKNNTWESIC